jgi:predicted PurR-regulated permease PerM
MSGGLVPATESGCTSYELEPGRPRPGFGSPDRLASGRGSMYIAARGEGAIIMEFSNAQQKTISVAVTILSSLLIVAAIVGLLWLIVQFISFFSGVLAPLLVAFIWALVVKPYYEWLRSRLRLNKLLAVLIVLASILIPIVGFSWFFGSLLLNQLIGLLERLPEWGTNIYNYLAEHQPKVLSFFQVNRILERLSTLWQEQGTAVVDSLKAIGRTAWSAGAGVFSLIITLAGWFVLPIYFGFFLMMEPPTEKLARGWMPFLKKDTQDSVVFLIREFFDIIVAFFRGQLIVALLQGSLFALGFMVVGLSYGLMLGIVMGLLNLIPYLGSMIGLAITLPLAYFQLGGGWTLLFLVIGVIVVVQMIEGYVITPRVMSGRTGLHPMMIIFALFFWGTALGGILGMVLAIPLTAFFVTFWRFVKVKYIKGIV